MVTYSVRPFNFKAAFTLPLVLMASLLIFEPSALDLGLARLMYVPESGFIGGKSFFLEDILHDRAKQLVIVFAVLAIIGFALSCVLPRFVSWRRRLGYVVLALGVSTALVTPVKAFTAVQCPWSLDEFGGQEVYSGLLGPRPTTTKPGRCWPGGHASAGFSLLALFFALRDLKPRAARACLVFAIGLGTVFSLGRMLQGAHFFSHNLWTFLFDWLICTFFYWLILYRNSPPAAYCAALQVAR